METVAGSFRAAFSVSFLAGPAMAGVLLGLFEPITVVWVTTACSRWLRSHLAAADPCRDR